MYMRQAELRWTLQIKQSMSTLNNAMSSQCRS
uniref:Uncharacterized protein n=1 Tax=Rhizophora mucronata TaxID=61149 RepID=A0A2P2R0A2_RHIMU